MEQLGVEQLKTLPKPSKTLKIRLKIGGRTVSLKLEVEQLVLRAQNRPNTQNPESQNPSKIDKKWF